MFRSVKRHYLRKVLVILKGLANSRSGNFGLMTALLAVPIVGSAGLAMDVVGAFVAKDDLQEKLDSATLAAAAEKAYMGLFNEQTALAYLNGQTKGAKFANLKFEENADGTITGRVTAEIPTDFMSLFGKNSMSLALSSTANALTQSKLAEVTLKIEHAQGAWSKDIFFFTKDKYGKIISETLVLSYIYDGTNFLMIPSITSDIKVKVGEYASYGYAMTVFKDFTYKGARVNPEKHYSDDPDSNLWIKSSGTCSDPGGILKMWEDGGDFNYLDFQFRQLCTSVTKSVGDVRLVR